MRKKLSFRYALLLSIFLFNVSSYGCVIDYNLLSQEQDISFIQRDKIGEALTYDPIILENDELDIHIDSEVKDTIPATINPLLDDEKTLLVLGTKISLGESVDSVIKKLGSPNRIAETELDFDYYVYNNNYSKLLFVAVKDKKVVGYYTDSIDFNYQGITSDSSLDMVNDILNMDFTMDYILSHTTDTYTLHILIDQIGTQKVTGISVLDINVKADGYTSKTMKDMELLVYDLTNSIRKRNGLPILSWSSTASKAARKHSIDMAKNSFFDHYNLSGKDPGDRLREEGISYSSIGENLIAGYGSAIISSHAWFNSSEHRANILNKKFRNLGVGFTYQEDSIYKIYITQNFYR